MKCTLFNTPVSMGTSVEHVLHLAMLSICLFPNSKCVIPSTATVLLWFLWLSMCSFKSMLLPVLRLSFCFAADCSYVCFSFLPPCPLCVSLVLAVSVRPSSISGQPTSAPATPTAAGGATYATLFPTSLTVHSFVSLHQYCCPSTDQSLQQEDR